MLKNGEFTEKYFAEYSIKIFDDYYKCNECVCKKAYILVDEYDRPNNILLAKVLNSDNENDYKQAIKNYNEVSDLINSIFCEVGKPTQNILKRLL